MRTATIFSMVLIAILLAACSQDAAKTPTTDTAAQNEPAAAPNEPTAPDTAPAAKPAETKAAETKPAETKTADSTSKLAALFEKKATLRFKVAYDTTTLAAGETVRMKMTQYFGGEDQIRTDMTASGIETRMYFVEQKMTVCSKPMGSWMCNVLDYKPTDAEATEKGIKEDPSMYTTADDGTKTVAGETATCYKVTINKGDSAGSITRYCLAKDGVPLYISTDAKSAANGTTVKTEMTATSVTRSVSDSDFVPPKSETPSGTGGYQLPPGVQIPSMG